MQNFPLLCPVCYANVDITPEKSQTSMPTRRSYASMESLVGIKKIIFLPGLVSVTIVVPVIPSSGLLSRGSGLSDGHGDGGRDAGSLLPVVPAVGLLRCGNASCLGDFGSLLPVAPALSNGGLRAFYWFRDLGRLLPVIPALRG